MNRETKITALAILAAATCGAGEMQRKVTVCMETTPTSEVVRAEAQASQMFSAIGVKLDWNCHKSGLQQAIVISLAARAPENRKPGETGSLTLFTRLLFFHCEHLPVPGS